MSHQLPEEYARVAVFVALTTFLLKGLATWLTGSVALFSDAVESIVNLATAVLLVSLLRIAAAPPDVGHPYGHDKAEYFAYGAQGALILAAGFGIVAAALKRLATPESLEFDTVGVWAAVVATVLNLAAARYLAHQGRQTGSEALTGEAAHLMSDVWTSFAVLLGAGLAFFTGHAWLDPVAALLISALVFWTGWKLLRNFVYGLMDSSLPEPHRLHINEVLDRHRTSSGIDFHALRTRVSGARTFVSLHVLVPGSWSVSKGHRLLDQLEEEIARDLPGKVTVLTHLEPLEEECSFTDMELD